MCVCVCVCVCVVNGTTAEPHIIICMYRCVDFTQLKVLSLFMYCTYDRVTKEVIRMKWSVTVRLSSHVWMKTIIISVRLCTVMKGLAGELVFGHRWIKIWSDWLIFDMIWHASQPTGTIKSAVASWQRFHLGWRRMVLADPNAEQLMELYSWLQCSGIQCSYLWYCFVVYYIDLWAQNSKGKIW